MVYSHEVEHMCVVKKGPNHGPAPIPEEGKWVQSKEIKDISGLTHGIGWCLDPHIVFAHAAAANQRCGATVSCLGVYHIFSTDLTSGMTFFMACSMPCCFCEA